VKPRRVADLWWMRDVRCCSDLVRGVAAVVLPLLFRTGSGSQGLPALLREARIFAAVLK